MTSRLSGVAFSHHLVVSVLCCLALACHLVTLQSRHVTLPSSGVTLGHDLISQPLQRLEFGRDPIASRVRLLALVRHLTQLAGHLTQALRSLCLVSFEAIELMP
jgi:hypothetical protein